MKKVETPFGDRLVPINGKHRKIKPGKNKPKNIPDGFKIVKTKDGYYRLVPDNSKR